MLRTTISGLLANKLGFIGEDSTINIGVGSVGSNNEVHMINQFKTAISPNIV